MTRNISWYLSYQSIYQIIVINIDQDNDGQDTDHINTAGGCDQ